MKRLTRRRQRRYVAARKQMFSQPITKGLKACI